MRYVRLALAAVCVAAIGSAAAAAERRDSQKNPRQPLGNNPHPVTWGGQQPRLAQPAARPAPPSHPSPTTRPAPARHEPPEHAEHDRRDNHHHDVDVRLARYLAARYLRGVYYDAFGNPYFYDYGYPQVYYSDQMLLAPAASQPWMGFAAAAQPRDAEPPEDLRSQLRGTNAQAVARSQKFVGYGDALFAKGKYAEANDRYRKAAQAAPQLPDALVRQAFALGATGRYDLAARAIKRAVALDPTWPKSGFALDELYQGNAAAKETHLEALAAAAQKRPNDADLLFLVGVYLYFDGQAARARPFFGAAAQLAGGNAEHIAPFLSNGKLAP
jgi:tetratricopeptide (TPR) repeat protein